MISTRYLSIGVLTASSLILFAGCGDREEVAPDEPAARDAGMITSDEPEAIESSDQVVSYGIGHNMGTNIMRQGGLDIDEDAFISGFRDGLVGNDPRIPEDRLRAAFMEVQAKAQAAAAEAAEANAAAGQTYLAANKAKPGVVTTETGLQYKVLESGDGPSPSTEDTVEVHYHGTLIDGTVFDSSVERGETVTFPVSGVIPGWTEALQMMSVGDKWQLTIPPSLAYGDRANNEIPPGSVLNFEVELIAIK